MPAHVPSLTSEAELLAAYINQQIDGISNAAYGLTDEQANARPTVSALTIAGLINHVIGSTTGWLDRAAAAPDAPPALSQEEAQAQYAAEWTPTQPLADLVAGLEDVKVRVTSLCATVDLAAAVPVPTDAPWWPKDTASWQVRWVLLHLVEEIARHAGHADILRESIDGATMYELKAGAEGWPATPWLTPWQPKS